MVNMGFIPPGTTPAASAGKDEERQAPGSSSRDNGEAVGSVEAADVPVDRSLEEDDDGDEEEEDEDEYDDDDDGEDEDEDEDEDDEDEDDDEEEEENDEGGGIGEDISSFQDDQAMTPKKPKTWDFAAEADWPEADVEALLKDVLLPRLPVRMVFQMRTVSKLFRDSPLQDLSSSFILAHPQESWLLLHKIPSSEISWLAHQPISWNLEVFSNVDRKRFTPPALTGPWLKDLVGTWTSYFPGITAMPCVASANGLLCAYVNPPFQPLPLSSSSDYHRPIPRVVVFNCLTGSAELLNPPHSHPLHHGMENIYTAGDTLIMADRIFIATAAPPSPTMSHDSNSKNAPVSAYYILLLSPLRDGCLPGDLSHWCRDGSIQVYDSSVGHWKFPQSMASAIQDSYSLLDCDFFTFYITLVHDEDTHVIYSKEGHILGYRASLDQWFKTTLTVDNMDEFFPPCEQNGFFCGKKHFEFVKHNERLLMFLRVVDRMPRKVMIESGTRRATLLVAEVSPVSHQFSKLVEISVMPKHYHQNGEPILAAGANFLSISFVPRMGSPRPKRHHVIIYDICKQIWYPLPLLGNDNFHYRCFCILEPRKAMNLPDFDSRKTISDCLRSNQESGSGC